MDITHQMAAAPDPSVIEAARRMGARAVVLSRENIVRVGASNVLAIDENFIGRTVMLSPAKGVSKRGGAAQGAVGVVPVRGPLAQRAISDMCGYVDGYDAILARFQAALNDDSIDAVVVDIDSPGGDVAGLAQAADAIRMAREASGKPVFVFANELIASAAYWLACAFASEGISLPEAGQIGSIGCIGGLLDETKALEMEGLSVTLVRVPDGKAEANSVGPIKDLAEERLRARVETFAGQFFDLVASVRGLSVDAVRGMNGAVEIGKSGVKAGLADRVETFESVVARAQTAGRKWRRQMEKAAMDEKRLADLETFQAKALAVFGSKTEAEFFGTATAARDTAAKAPEQAAKLAAAEDNVAALTAQIAKGKADGEAEQAIRAAEAIKKIVPGNVDKAKAHYEKFGLESLKSYLDGLVPLPVNSAVSEAKQVAQTPTSAGTFLKDASGEIAKVPFASASGDAKAYESMSYIERHNFRKANGEEAYAALKKDWIDRGSPKPL